MKRHLSTTIYFVFIILSVNSQNNFLSEKALNILPPSPNVGALLSYGDTPVNMFTGTSSISIPLYTIQTEQIVLPITLSYSARGIKVEEIASSTGMGWTLNMGGVINKTIRGNDDNLPLSDGYPNGYSGVRVNKFINDELNAEEKRNFSYHMANGGADGEPDIYSYNFGKYNGKFIFSPEGEITQLYGAPLNIEKTSDGFKIIDPDGIIYYFNDKEETQRMTEFRSDGDAAPLDPHNFVSAWHLSKIILLGGKTIDFQYFTSVISPEYQGSESYYLLQSLERTCANYHPPKVMTTSSRSNTTIQQKKVKKILFPGGEIEIQFQNSDRLDLSGDKAIQSIIVKNHEGKEINKYEFGYKYFSNRLFLSTFRDFRASEPYRFFYDESGILPNRDSKAQDYWGFYNGKNSNSTLIPKINDININIIPNFYYKNGADRTPQFEFMRLGILERILYPTGGETYFNYESHEYGNISGEENIQDTIVEYGEETLFLNAGTDGRWIESEPFDIDFRQEIDITSRVTGYNTKTRLVTSSGEVIFSHESNGSSETNTVQQKKILDPGTYKLMAFNYEREFTVNIQIFYKEKISETTSKSRKGGGIRIKDITDYSLPGVIAKKRSYEYKLRKEPGRSSGILVTNYIHEYRQYKYGQIGECVPGTTYKALYFVRLSSSAIPLYTSSGSHIEYSEVIEKYDNDGSNGKTYNSFISSKDSDLRVRDINFYSYPFIPSISREYKRGGIKESEIFSNISGEYTLVKKVSNEYQEIPSSDAIYGLSIGLDVENPQFPQDNTYVYNSYFIYRDFIALKKNIEYIYNDGHVFEKSMDYFYDNVLHYQLTRTKLINSKGKTITTKTLYPQDISNRTAAENKLITQHRIAEPIQTEMHQDGVKLSTLRNIFGDTWGNNQVLLKEICASKGMVSPVSRIRYQKYDTYGNPEELSIVNGPHITYLWGYNGQYPVAKIENATYADVTATGVNLSVLQNTSSTEAAKIAELNKIRNHTSMINARVTTYTYSPLIGVSMITDPRGEKTTYTYDSFNRLEFIKDETNKLLEEYKYHYKN